MAKIFPFRAFRYHLPNSKLSKAVCPPYDVIQDRVAKKLRKNFANAIQIELPAGSQKVKYQRAKRIWQKWEKTNIVRQDSESAFYIYEQHFALKQDSKRRAPAKHFSRKGFFCALQIEKPGSGSILRHELTLPKPKQDRLNLLKTLQVNTSPIFGLFEDRRGRIRKILKRFSRTKPLHRFKDSEQVIHRLWRCSDASAIKTVQEQVKKIPVVIADGHHRYETAWNYSQSQTNGNEKKTSSSATLFYLCPRESAGIVILPTHRVLRKKAQAQINFERFVKRAESCKKLFDVVPLPPHSDPVHFIKNPSLQGESGHSFLITDGIKFVGVKVRSSRQLSRLFPRMPRTLLSLPLFQLHSILLPRLAKEDFIYLHDQKEAVSLALKNRTLAFLVPPVSVQELYAVVQAGALMPQKSTYFYPKVITGLIFRSLG